LVVEAPEPRLAPEWVLVRNHFSLISAGTERSKIEMGQKSLLEKARARPDLVKTVIDRARSEGLRSTRSAVNERLDGLADLGYSCAGVVERVGPAVRGLAPGDRVACGGGGWASHAELVAVPQTLCARVPDGVELDAAAFATVGAIAMHGLRQAEVDLGARVAVIGLGLVGQLTVKLLLAAGALPIGIDLDAQALRLAEAAGATTLNRTDPGLEARVAELTGGAGADAVIVCAAAPTSDPVELAARLARDRGRIVIVGAVKVEADRALLYDKELEVRLSRSYGPGRYDREYEDHGRDLPLGYVRWTEQRNIQAFVDLVGAGRLDPSDLITHRFGVEDAEAAYGVLSESGDKRPFAVLLEYPHEAPRSAPLHAAPTAPSAAGGVAVSVIGAGSFARRVLIPALSGAGARLVSVSTASGLSAADVKDRLGFERVADSAEAVVEDPATDGVVIATRHADHAALTATALRAGKHVLVEKPLALTADELDDVEQALAAGGGLMVGFNRRFAPMTQALKEAVPAPQLVNVRVNAGPIPDDSWVHDLQDGGGRLLGEGCHFIDLAIHLLGGRVRTVHTVAAPAAGRPIAARDDFVVTLEMDSGHVGVIVYCAAGDPRMSKERIEVFGAGASAVLDDFRRLEVFRNKRRSVQRGRQDKGHAAEVACFIRSLTDPTAAPPVDTYLHASRVTLAALDSLVAGVSVPLA
jgi:predicted dehydrogenase/threonine dehydrogenase-like Zn-dependent dehydrogenase